MKLVWREQRRDIKVLSLSVGITGAAKKLMDGFRDRVTKCGQQEAVGPATPSSGFVAVYLMLYLCQRVSVYGFGTDVDPQ